MDQRGLKSPSGAGHEGALCALHRAGDVGSCGVGMLVRIFPLAGLIMSRASPYSSETHWLSINRP